MQGLDQTSKEYRHKIVDKAFMNLMTLKSSHSSWPCSFDDEWI